MEKGANSEIDVLLESFYALQRKEAGRWLASAHQVLGLDDAKIILSALCSINTSGH